MMNHRQPLHGGADQGITVELASMLTCPECGDAKTETMPTDACQWFL